MNLNLDAVYNLHLWWNSHEKLCERMLIKRELSNEIEDNNNLI